MLSLRIECGAFGFCCTVGKLIMLQMVFFGWIVNWIISCKWAIDVLIHCLAVTHRTCLDWWTNCSACSTPFSSSILKPSFNLLWNWNEHWLNYSRWITPNVILVDRSISVEWPTFFDLPVKDICDCWIRVLNVVFAAV